MLLHANVLIYRRDAPDTCHKPKCDDDPQLCPGTQICEPKPPAWMGMVEVVCVALFSLDYVSRMVLVSTVPARYILSDSLQHFLCAIDWLASYHISLMSAMSTMLLIQSIPSTLRS